eukprot:gnl/TRDRNA2_/TRDRNA2_83482_c0_seq1.p1 gnl/TRDRNA2_/TRDRNA2_83482_c0~~gnl/TRDRNA2_/TRDRNA2_83482_c0_seq1.p1  ORF type:complete len:203 (+),score=30.92 gnl/TRDRNA2_/TRDRNA2_83482_c0_seq1:52-660(+)
MHNAWVLFCLEHVNMSALPILSRGEGALRALSSGAFAKVVSLEVSHAHWQVGTEKLKLPIATGMLDLRLGDSQDLWEHIKDFSEPITFWLDAHDDQETTDRGGQHDAPKKPCPLLEELAAIARHPVRTHTILIDDWGCFAPGFTHSKHTWFAGVQADEVRLLLQKINPDYRIFTIDGLRKDDILVAQIPANPTDVESPASSA